MEKYVLAQAARYGAQVGQLDDHPDTGHSRALVREAYLTFKAQFDDPDLLAAIRDAYWDAYSSL